MAGDFLVKLKEAIDSRSAWFENSEFPKIKEEFRTFHRGVSSLYGMFVKKGFISEDPYKNDMKINDIAIPESGPFADNNKRDQLGLRLAELDNQIDFLLNFYPFNMEGFSQDKIKIILGIVKYVDWMHLTPDSSSVITAAISVIVTDARRTGGQDPLSAKLLTDSLSDLSKKTPVILNFLKQVSDFNRELYKYDVRASITGSMSAADATLVNIKKKFPSALPGIPFFSQLVEEVVKEDFSKDSAVLQEKLLKKLVVAGEKTKAVKAPPSFKPILITGLNAIGSAGATLTEIMEKVRENHDLLENNKKGIWEKIKKMLSQMVNKEPEPVIYELEYIDPSKNAPVREKINFNSFSADIEKKIAILNAMTVNGVAAKKIQSMEEKQLMEILQKNIVDVQNFHKTLGGFDDYFKNQVDKADRARVKGIKPELSALKNATSKANQQFHDYNAQKEEEEQFKRLGIQVAT